MDNFLDENQFFHFEDSYLDEQNFLLNNYATTNTTNITYSDNQLKDENLFNEISKNSNQSNFTQLNSICSNRTDTTFDLNQTDSTYNLNYNQLINYSESYPIAYLNNQNNRNDQNNLNDQNDLNDLNCEKILTNFKSDYQRDNPVSEANNQNTEFIDDLDLDVETLKKFFHSDNDENFINEYLSDCNFDTSTVNDVDFSDLPKDNLKLDQNESMQNCLINQQLETEIDRNLNNVFSLDDYIKSESIGDFIFDYSSSFESSDQTLKQPKIYRCTFCKYSSLDKSKVIL